MTRVNCFIGNSGKEEDGRGCAVAQIFGDPIVSGPLRQSPIHVEVGLWVLRAHVIVRDPPNRREHAIFRVVDPRPIRRDS